MRTTLSLFFLLFTVTISAQQADNYYTDWETTEVSSGNRFELSDIIYMSHVRLYPEHMNALLYIKDFLESHADFHLEVHTYTSSDGEATHQLTGSERQAHYLKKTLMEECGILAVRISCHAHGQDEAIFSKETLADIGDQALLHLYHELNLRSELVLVKK